MQHRARWEIRVWTLKLHIYIIHGKLEFVTTYFELFLLYLKIFEVYLLYGGMTTPMGYPMGENVNLEEFKNELRMDIRRMQAALAALEGQTMKELSTETRRKISESMKANWAGRQRTMPEAVKEKIAASQKARWEKRKATAPQITAV